MVANSKGRILQWSVLVHRGLIWKRLNWIDAQGKASKKNIFWEVEIFDYT